MNLPAIELTEADLAKHLDSEQDREYLPAVLSCRERQLAFALTEAGNLNDLRDVANVALDQRDAAIEEIKRLRGLLRYAYDAPLGRTDCDPSNADGEDLRRHETFQCWRSEVGRTLVNSQAQEEAQAMQRMKASDAAAEGRY